MQDKLEEDDFDDRLVFSDEATFHTSGKVNKHNVRSGAKKILMAQLKTRGTHQK